MKFQLTFSLDKPEIPTKDYRRIFASIIKNALSRYMDGQLFEKFYKDTKQKDFTWSVISLIFQERVLNLEKMK